MIEVMGGGVVQAVYSNGPVDVMLVEWNDIAAGDSQGAVPLQPLKQMSSETRVELTKVAERGGTNNEQRDCTVRLYVSSDEKQAIKERMRQLKFRTESDYLRWLL